MQIAQSQFLHNVKGIRELGSLHDFLKNSQNLSYDLSDLLRAEIVYAVSALDKFVHELIRIGMIEAFSGKRVRTTKFEGFTISAKTLEKIKETAIERNLNPNHPPLPDELPEYWFEQEIVLKHKQASYQTPININDGLSLIWKEEYKWQKIATDMGLNEKSAKTQLETIVARRNQIVHEADLNFETGLRNNISAIDVKDSVDFIENLGNTIFSLVK